MIAQRARDDVPLVSSHARRGSYALFALWSRPSGRDAKRATTAIGTPSTACHQDCDVPLAEIEDPAGYREFVRVGSALGVGYGCPHWDPHSGR